MMYYLNDLNSITIAHGLPDILGSEARSWPRADVKRKTISNSI